MLRSGVLTQALGLLRAAADATQTQQQFLGSVAGGQGLVQLNPLAAHQAFQAAVVGHESRAAGRYHSRDLAPIAIPDALPEVRIGDHQLIGRNLPASSGRDQPLAQDPGQILRQPRAHLPARCIGKKAQDAVQGLGRVDRV